MLVLVLLLTFIRILVTVNGVTHSDLLIAIIFIVALPDVVAARVATTAIAAAIIILLRDFFTADFFVED